MMKDTSSTIEEGGGRDNSTGEGGGIKSATLRSAGADAFGLHHLGPEHVIGLRDTHCTPNLPRA